MVKGMIKQSVALLAAVWAGLAFAPAASAQATIEDALSNVNDGLEACIRAVVDDTLDPVESLTILDCGGDDFGIVTFIGIQQFIALTELKVTSESLGASPSLDDVATLSNLEVLWLSGNEIESIADLAALSGLRDLRIAANELSGDLSSTLGQMLDLEILDLSSNEITSVGGASTGVALLTSLEELYIGGNEIQALPGLSGLNSLETLEASGNQLSTFGIGSLANLVDAGGTDTTLKNLGLADNQISNVAVIAGLVGLETLSLSDNDISSIGNLGGLDALEFLNVANFTPAPPNNTITTLNVLTNAGAGDPLEALFASNNALVDVGALANKPNLQVVFVDGNELSNVDSLAGADDLQTLVARSNKITSLFAFADAADVFTDVTSAATATLDLSDNYVQGFFAELANLPQGLVIDLTGNPLICDDVANLDQLGNVFDPTAIIGDPLVCSDDSGDTDRFGAYDSSVLAAFPEGAFDQWPDDPDVALDTDLDGAPDGFLGGATSSAINPTLVQDAFPLDLAASVDTDSDGFPDDWNPGQSELTSTTGLRRDAFADDAAAWEDTDGDGCPNELFGASTSSPPLIEDALPDRAPECIDADGDGIGPDEEAANGTTDDNPDSDSDGLLDGEEVISFGTDPADPDSDGDDFNDGDEVDFGSDPNDSDDIPMTGLNIPLIFKAIEQAGAAP